MKTASSGGTGRGWAPGIGSEMTRLVLEVCRGLEPPRAAEPICWARSMALSGSLLGSEQACCHTGIFWVRRSLPWMEDVKRGHSMYLQCNQKYNSIKCYLFSPPYSIFFFLKTFFSVNNNVNNKTYTNKQKHTGDTVLSYIKKPFCPSYNIQLCFNS